ncbi:MAG: succinylglutamate desuccinylase/aspartoacylase family protein, partial [Planctomycetes bacterium]|nr:succinylglutamate desuccinylase/aspartoacylase family protein [Planctomycetota bacterium]
MGDFEGQSPWPSEAPCEGEELLSGKDGVLVEERIIDQIVGAKSDPIRDPVLICVGGLHGNEPGGVDALVRVTRELRAQGQALDLKGTLLALRGNRGALAHKKRYIDADLNRAWAKEDLARVRTQDPCFDGPTDREVRELLACIEKPVSQGRRVFLLDMHSTSGGGPPFSVVLGGRDSERLAAQIGVPCVHGLNESIQGTLTSWFSAHHGPSIVV